MRSLKQLSVYAMLSVVMALLMMMLNTTTAASLQQYIGPTRRDSILKKTGETPTRVYYIHKNRFTNLQAARDSCEADGGRLADIDHKDEYNFISSFLTKVTDVGKRVGLAINIIIPLVGPWIKSEVTPPDFRKNYTIHIEGTYKAEDGAWVLPSTGQPLPYTNWNPKIKHNETVETCLALRYPSKTTWFMVPTPCEKKDPSQYDRFLCKKPNSHFGSFKYATSDPKLVSMRYDNKIYYIHKTFRGDYQKSLDDCRADRGTLAEINDKDEFEAIQSYLTAMAKLTVAYIGGIKTADGLWVLPSTNESLPYTNWGEYEPVEQFNCLTIINRGVIVPYWEMASFECHLTGAHALCELNPAEHHIFYLSLKDGDGLMVYGNDMRRP